MGKLLRYPSFFANLRIYPWPKFKLLKYPYKNCNTTPSRIATIKTVTYLQFHIKSPPIHPLYGSSACTPRMPRFSTARTAKNMCGTITSFNWPTNPLLLGSSWCTTRLRREDNVIVITIVASVVVVIIIERDKGWNGVGSVSIRRKNGVCIGAAVRIKAKEAAGIDLRVLPHP